MTKSSYMPVGLPNQLPHYGACIHTCQTYDWGTSQKNTSFENNNGDKPCDNLVVTSLIRDRNLTLRLTVHLVWILLLVTWLE